MRILRMSFSLFVCLLLTNLSALSQVMRTDGSIVKRDSAEGIQYLLIKVYRENDTEKMTLINSKVRPGHLKREVDISIKHAGGNSLFVFSLLNNKKELLHSSKFGNPLVEHLEYVDEDGHFKQTEIISDEKEFLVRVPFRRENSIIRFEKVAKEKQNLRNISNPSSVRTLIAEISIN